MKQAFLCLLFLLANIFNTLLCVQDSLAFDLSDMINVQDNHDSMNNHDDMITEESIITQDDNDLNAIQADQEDLHISNDIALSSTKKPVSQSHRSSTQNTQQTKKPTNIVDRIKNLCYSTTTRVCDWIEDNTLIASVSSVGAMGIGYWWISGKAGKFFNRFKEHQLLADEVAYLKNRITEEQQKYKALHDQKILTDKELKQIQKEKDVLLSNDAKDRIARQEAMQLKEDLRIANKKNNQQQENFDQMKKEKDQELKKSEEKYEYLVNEYRNLSFKLKHAEKRYNGFFSPALQDWWVGEPLKYPDPPQIPNKKE